MVCRECSVDLARSPKDWLDQTLLRENCFPIRGNDAGQWKGRPESPGYLVRPAIVRGLTLACAESAQPWSERDHSHDPSRRVL